MANKAKAVVPDIAGAEKKLRQAEFFLGQLEHASEDYRALGRGEASSERLEFYFSACLTASQSIYYILDETGSTKFKKTQRDWRMSLKNDADRRRFGNMIGLRDSDVHYGKTGAKPLQKYVEEDRLRDRTPYSMRSNALLLGWDQVVEEENPDGKKVRGSVLRGAIGLYLDRDGGTVEATTACREFIDQLRSLLEATKAAITHP